LCSQKYKISDFDGSLITEENICHNDKFIPINALWDTGSSESVISSKLATKFLLKPIGSALLNGTNLSNRTNVYEIILLPANEQKINLQVTGSRQISESNIDLLIGLDVISMCDFALSADDENICMSVRYPSNGSIDFTNE